MVRAANFRHTQELRQLFENDISEADAAERMYVEWKFMNKSFVFNDIIVPIPFRAIRYSRRAQLWNRQASIIMDLTILALRHGWPCLPRV